MLRVSLDTLNAIAQGAGIDYEVIVYWQEPETYTKADYLQDVGDISAGMSEEGSYEIANVGITLKNTDYYFSRKFARELPNNKLVEIYQLIAGQRILAFRGVVAQNWKLTPMGLTLNINA